jgi:hypothetical protein
MAGFDPSTEDVDEHKHVLPHAAFGGQTPDEMYFGTGDEIPAELAARAGAASRARLQANRISELRSVSGTHGDGMNAGFTPRGRRPRVWMTRIRAGKCRTSCHGARVQTSESCRRAWPLGGRRVATRSSGVLPGVSCTQGSRLRTGWSRHAAQAGRLTRLVGGEELARSGSKGRSTQPRFWRNSLSTSQATA